MLTMDMPLEIFLTPTAQYKKADHPHEKKANYTEEFVIPS